MVRRKLTVLFTIWHHCTSERQKHSNPHQAAYVYAMVYQFVTQIVY